MSEEISKHVLKTGTLTIGLVCKDGIVLAADRRQSFADGGGGVRYIAGDNAKKIENVNERVVVTTAGTASDTRKIIALIRAELRLKELKTRERASLKETASLFSSVVYQSIRNFSTIPSLTHFLLAGYDDQKSGLFNIMPDGYIEEIDTFATSGSGMFQADSILDSEYNKNLTVQEGTKLAVKCIRAAMGREPSVGGGVDLYVIKKGELKQVLDQTIVSELKNTH